MFKKSSQLSKPDIAFFTFISSFLFRINPTEPCGVWSVRYTMLLLKKESGRKGSEIKIFPFSGILSSGRIVNRSSSGCTADEFTYTIYKK
jgi:hypothetical protein